MGTARAGENGVRGRVRTLAKCPPIHEYDTACPCAQYRMNPAFCTFSLRVYIPSLPWTEYGEKDERISGRPDGRR